VGDVLPDILDPAGTDLSAGWLRKDPNIHHAERLHPSPFPVFWSVAYPTLVKPNPLPAKA
jgi:hypothetical protein